MPGITAVIITKNEEANIGRCLASLKGVVDEIVVVDSHSTDRTGEICAEHGAKFVQRPFEGYSETKNYGNSLASQDYILSIDADEALSEQLRTSMLEAKKGMTSEAYTMKRLSNYCGRWIRHSGWYPDVKLRLWKRNLVTWEGKVHETPVYSGGKPALLKGDLLHYTYDSFATHATKLVRYANLSAEEMFAKGRRASMMKLWLSPAMAFFRVYVLRLGFRDGYYGMVLAAMTAYYNFMKYAGLRDRLTQARKKP